MDGTFFHGICVDALSDVLTDTHDSCCDVIGELQEHDLVSKYHSCFQLYNLLFQMMTLCNLCMELIDHHLSKEEKFNG